MARVQFAGGTQLVQCVVHSLEQSQNAANNGNTTIKTELSGQISTMAMTFLFSTVKLVFEIVFESEHGN